MPSRFLYPDPGHSDAVGQSDGSAQRAVTNNLSLMDSLSNALDKMCDDDKDVQGEISLIAKSFSIFNFNLIVCTREQVWPGTLSLLALSVSRCVVRPSGFTVMIHADNTARRKSLAERAPRYYTANTSLQGLARLSSPVYTYNELHLCGTEDGTQEEICCRFSLMRDLGDR